LAVTVSDQMPGSPVGDELTDVEELADSEASTNASDAPGEEPVCEPSGDGLDETAELPDEGCDEAALAAAEAPELAAADATPSPPRTPVSSPSSTAAETTCGGCIVDLISRVSSAQTRWILTGNDHAIHAQRTPSVIPSPRLLEQFAERHAPPET